MSLTYPAGHLRALGYTKSTKRRSAVSAPGWSVATTLQDETQCPLYLGIELAVKTWAASRLKLLTCSYPKPEEHILCVADF